jgi:citrate lyase subunit beta/citryl-CoA lyase
MGFDGKWAIHPGQIPVIHLAFTPSQEEITRAREIIDLYEQSDANSGVGAMVYKDEMIDAASLPMERRKLAIAKKSGLPRKTETP